MSSSVGREVAARGHDEIWTWEHAWRWDYAGWVWIDITPDHDSVGQDVEIYARWGARVRPTLCPRVPAEGIVLCTGKGFDKSGRATPMILTSSQRLSVRCGTGQEGFPTGKKHFDITGPWKAPSYFAHRKSGLWVEPKGRLDPRAQPLLTPRTW